MTPRLKILIVEDCDCDVTLLEHELTKAGMEFSSVVVADRDLFGDALKSFDPDVILVDHFLPRFNSIEALEVYREHEATSGVSIPFILVTGHASEELAIQCMKQGVDDYILKDRLRRLPFAIESALERRRLEAERKKYTSEHTAEKEVEELHPFGVFQMDLVSGHHVWSDELYNIYGYAPGEVEPTLDRFYEHVCPEDHDRLRAGYAQSLHNLHGSETDFRIADANGNVLLIHSKYEVIVENGVPVRIVGVNIDITPPEEVIRELLLRSAGGSACPPRCGGGQRALCRAFRHGQSDGEAKE